MMNTNTFISICI